MKFKKVLAAIMSAAMMLAMSSCGNGGDKQVPETATETAETTAEGKKTIKLTLLGGLDTNLELRIADFNKTSEEYEIEVEDRPSSDLAKAIDTLNLEVIAGNTPDIIDGFFLPIESYAEKGLLADYYNFIDNDPEMCREDFLENVFKSYEINGGLYQNISGFSLDTLMGKSSIMSEMQGRTSDDFIDLAEKYPDKKFFDMPTSKYSIFDEFMRYGWRSFIDNETGKCDFTGEKFIRILEFCNTYPDKADSTVMSDPNWSQSEADDLRNGKTLFTLWGRYISDFYSLRTVEEHTFDEPVTVVGYPDAEGNGVLIDAIGSYLVFESSPVKEGAWEFLRYYYSDEYQKWLFKGNGVTAGGVFPIKKSVLKAAAEDAKKGLYLMHLDDYSDEIVPNTDEDNQRILDLINGATYRANTSESFAYNIIIEEAEMYFSGQRPAKETAEIIQNRVQNYLDENR